MTRSLSRQNSHAETIQHTGLSLEIGAFNIDDENDELEPEVKGKGVVVVVSRVSASGKITIKPHAVQTSFFALPLKPSKEDIKAVDEKVKDIMASYEANKYRVERHDFNLPFEVEAICRVTKGYTPTAKPMKAEDLKKKRKANDADADADADAGLKGKKRRATDDEPKRKMSRVFVDGHAIIKPARY